MTHDVKYDRHYRDDPAACGTPFAEFEAHCRHAKPGDLLDLGCGQGRDALMFARAGHRVVGVDLSAVGIRQMLATASAEDLDVHGVVADLATYEPTQRFHTVILDRVLHMLPAAARPVVLATAMDAVAPGGHLLVAEGAKGMAPVRATVEQAGWTLVMAKSNRLIATRPPPRDP